MSTSGSTNYSLATNEIITEAFDICGIGSEGESMALRSVENGPEAITGVDEGPQRVVFVMSVRRQQRRVTLDDDVAIAGGGQAASHAGQRRRLSSLDVDLRQLHGPNLCTVEHVVQCDRVDIEIRGCARRGSA